jgi:hypothetical protein
MPLGVSPRCYAVFTVLTSPVRLCRVSNIGDGSVIEPNHHHVARVLIADDNELACLTELLDRPFRLLSESL